MTKRLLLLDFDGVVLKKHKLFDQVKTRCIQYVEKHMHIRNPEKAKLINKQLYTSTGHTVLGLQKLGYEEATIEDFNNYVYDFLDYSKAVNFEEDDMQHLKQAIDYCTRRHVDVKICSNAPDRWVYNVLAAMPYDFTHLKTTSHITTEELKPTQKCFDKLEHDYQHYKQIYYVDDQLINIIPIINNSRWTPIMFSHEVQHSKYLWLTSYIPLINNLSHVADIIEHDIIREDPHQLLF